MSFERTPHYLQGMQELTEAEFLALAHGIATELNDKVEQNFEQFLSFIYKFPIMANKKGQVTLNDDSSAAEISEFLRSYLEENFAARKKRIVLKEVTTKADEAVDVVLESFGKYKPEILAIIKEHHRASMASENKVGDLLEAYLATLLETKGWFWCSCSILKGGDFFKAGVPPRILQVKNRSNSENSSSQKIRKALETIGCPVEIEKWHRSSSMTGKTRWEKLSENEAKQLTEQGFLQFIRSYEIVADATPL